MLVGLGPGSNDHLTARARAAIAEADTIIGYVTYIRLVADLVEGKEVIKKSMTEELDRAIESLERARQGKKVALISSGDAGVYGMAGPTFEVLFQAGWTPDSGIEVEIIPGASALNTCAALVGAPLTHDFCAISLSDLLTPWPTIARRLDAVAYADFVVALYNPKSGRRTGQIVEAQRLFLRHRRPADAGGHRQIGLPPETAHRIHHAGENERMRHRHAVHGADRQFQHLHQARPDGDAARLRQQIRR
jgi:precorrin-3B C17-methyltransferase